MKVKAPFRLEWTRKFKAYGNLTRFMLVWVYGCHVVRFGVEGAYTYETWADKPVMLLTWRRADDLRPWNAGRLSSAGRLA